MRKKFLLMLTLLILALGGGGNLFAQTQVTDFNSLVSAIQNGETTIEVDADITTETDLVVPAGVTINVNASLNVLNTITNNGIINVRTMVYVVEEVQPYFGFSYNKTATKNGSISGNVPSSINYQISLDGGNTWFEDTTNGKAQAVTVKTDGTIEIKESFQSAFTSATTGETVHMLKDAHVQSTNPKKNNGPLRSYYGLILEGNGHTIYTDLESSGASNEYATIKFTSYLAGTGPEVNPILKNVTINSQNNAKADIDYVSGDVTFTVTMYNVNLLGNCQYASFAMKSNSMIINKSNVKIFDCTIPSWDANSANAIDFYSGEYSLTLNNKCTVYGGTFTKDVTNYLADGVEMEKVNGKYVVSRSYVAKIGDNKYYSLEEAFTAATEDQTITLLADATPALTSQRAITKAAVIDLGGKTLNLTEDDLYFGTTTFKNGTIVVDPSVKPSTAVFWMFANQTLTFDKVKVVATGVTGTYLIGLDGNNSDLNLLNGSEILVENTTALDLDIICVNASTGNDIKVENSKVNVTNLDGRVFFRGNYTVSGNSEVKLEGITKAGFRIEAGQTLTIADNAIVNIVGEPRDGGIHLTDFTATYTKAETATVNATLNRPYAAQIGEDKYITFAEAIAAAQTGDEIVMLSDVTLDDAITLPANITLNGNGKQINGTIYAGGNLTFVGHTKVTAFSASYYDRVITIGEGACLEITGGGRVSLAYGNTFNITGSIENAKTADKSNVQASLIIPAGISITGGNDATMNVTNAYVKIGSTTSKNSVANGTFTMNFTNSIAEFTNQLTFAEPTSGMNPTFNLNITNSILTTGTKLIAAAPKSNIVVDNSNVTLATYFRNSGTFNVKNGSVLTGATIQFGENGGNNGELIVDASTFTITASSVGHALDGKSTGKIVLKNAAIANIDYIKDMDELYMTKDSKLYSKTSGLNIQTEHTYKVVYNNEVYEAVDATIYVATKAELKSAIEGAEDGTFIKMTANIDYGADQLAITKNINLNLGGFTLTTANAYGGMSVKGNPTIKNGTIVHKSNTAAIKVWNATAFEDLVIDVQGKGDANKTIGGIVLQSGSTTRVGSIKNVTIEGAALTNGIETYNCGDASENVIGSMENVTINAVGTGMLISAPCGTATNCDIKGGVNGIEIWIKGTYSASLDLVDSKVEGGVYAHDEFSNNPDVVNNGILKLTADEETTGADVDDVTLTIARAKAENVQGEIFEYIMENAVAKGNNTFYASLQEAIIASAPNGTVEILADVTVDEWIMIATNLTMGDGSIITLDINGMTINGNNHTITIKDIESAGNGGYLFYDAAELNIKDLTISYAAGLTGGICLKKGTIEKVTFTGGKYGVLPGANGVTIKECTFNGTTSYAVYYEDAREGIVVTGNKFNTAEGAYAIIMRSNEQFTNNTITKGRVNIANSSKATVTGNNFGDERFKVYNGATATIENNTINVLAFNDNSVVKSTFSKNTLSDEAQAVLDAAVTSGGTWGGIDWTLTNDGTLTIAPTKGTPVADPNCGKTYEVGAWREAVLYNSKGEGVDIKGWPYDRSKVKTLVIEEGVISIGSFTAQSFTNLTGEVVIPSTVKYIGQEAFQKSTMTKLTFAEGGSEELCIAQGAFKNLIIEEVSLPEDRPVHLHAWVFNNCHNLKHATMPATVVSVHGTNHIDYFKDFNAHSNPTWTKSSEIFAYNENMETVTFGDEKVMDMFYANSNGTSKDYLKANVGLVTYCDVQDAIAAAAESGNPISLIKNTNTGSEDNKLEIPAGETIIIDLKDKEMTGSILAPNANLTVKNGTIKNTNKDVSAIEINKGTLTIENVNINSARHALRIDGEVTATINGGTYKSAQGTGTGTYHAANISGNANVTINGGTFVGPNGNATTTADSGSAINVQSGASVIINNGTYKGGKTKTLSSEGTLVLYGGTYDQDPSAFVAENYMAVKEGDLYTVGEIIAKIDETPYASLQAAINNVKNGETITFTKDITENVTITQKEGVSFTIDGNQKTLKGVMTVFGQGRQDGEETLTINNINFVAIEGVDACVVSPDRTKNNCYSYAHNVTVQNCTFKGIESNPYTATAIRHEDGGDKNWTVKNCTVDVNMHSLLQVNNVIGKLTVDGCTVKSKNGLNLNSCTNVELTNNTIEVKGYAVRAGVKSGGNPEEDKAYVLSNNTLKTDNTEGDATIVIRTSSANMNLSMEKNVVSGNTHISGTTAAIQVSADANYWDGETAPVVSGTAVKVYSYYADEQLQNLVISGLKGEGTEANPYLINNIADLKFFRDAVNAGNNYSGKFVKLTTDIDLNNEDWTPIGTSANTFNGMFDGQKHTINNLYINDSKDYVSGGNNDNYVGLFGYMKGGNTSGIKNLNIHNVNITGCLYVGSVLGRSYTGGIIENCHVSGNISIDSYAYTGGIVGRHEYSRGANENGETMSIYNCSVKGEINTRSANTINADYAVSYVGGIVGFVAEGDYVFENCEVENVTISGIYGVGGISGIAHYGNTISEVSADNVSVISTNNDPENNRTGNIGLIVGAVQGTEAEPSIIEDISIENTTANVTYTDGTIEQIFNIYGTNMNGSTPVTNYVAQIVGGTQYTSVIEALQAAIDTEASELVILKDVREKMTVDFDLVIKSDLTITAEKPVKVEFYNEGTSMDFAVGSTNGNTLTIAENVHFDLTDRVIWLGYYGNNVDVVVNGYLGGYQIWHGADTKVTATGKLDSHGEAFIMRRNATLTVEEGEVNANYFQIYSGHIEAEDATITAGLVWINNNHNYGSEGTVSMSLDNTTFTSRGEVKVYAGEGKQVPITLTSSTTFTAAGALTTGENVIVKADATSDFIVKGKSIFVAETGDYKYPSLATAIGVAEEGATVTVIQNITLAETATIAAGKVVTLDLNGYTISAAITEQLTKSFAAIKNKGTLTVKDSATTRAAGKITVSYAGASFGYGVGLYTISNEGGTLNIESGIVENTTEVSESMYDAIDNNSTTGNTVLNIIGGEVKCAYIGVRQFANSTTYENIVKVTGGKVVGGNTSIWMQNPGSNQPKATIAISGDAYITGRLLAGTSENFVFNVTGGTFTVNPQDFCHVDYTAIENNDGTFTVKQTSGTQTREFTKGWNWFSSYVNLSTNDPTNNGLEKLETALGTSGIQIKGRNNQFANYTCDEEGNNCFWFGAPFILSPTKMYMIKTSEPISADNFEISGDLIDYETTAISINKGWNWISYPLQKTVEINEALKNLDAEHDDMIKGYGQNIVSRYYRDRWVPSIDLVPGQGYMYKSESSEPKPLIYSASSTGNNSRGTTKPEASVENNYWRINASQYANNMVVFGMLSVDGEIMDSEYEIAAFANGECRGSARPIYIEELGQYMVFMTIYGEEEVALTFKCYDVNYGTEYELSNRVNYSNDAVLGSIDEPYMFNMNFLNIEESTLDMINIYPNPTTRDRAINLQATCDNVEVFNALGVKVAEYQNVDTIDALETAGVYVIRVTINGETRNCRLVVE